MPVISVTPTVRLKELIVKIKELKRHCYGFRNLNNFFNRIDCIFLLNQKEASTAYNSLMLLLKVLHQYDLTKSPSFDNSFQFEIENLEHKKKHRRSDA